MKFKTYVLK